MRIYYTAKISGCLFKIYAECAKNYYFSVLLGENRFQKDRAEKGENGERKNARIALYFYKEDGGGNFHGNGGLFHFKGDFEGFLGEIQKIFRARVKNFRQTLYICKKVWYNSVVK